MKKFDITSWADFVRGTIDDETRAQMQASLDTGASAKARRQVAALERVMQLAETDRQLEIPTHALRCVYALGSLRRPEAETEAGLSWLRRLAMSVRFDSLTTAEAGVRDLHADHMRQVVFEQEDFLVDLRIESEAGRTLVVGQLMRGGEQVEPLADVPILAVTGDRVWARSSTSDLGEFQAENLPSREVELLVLVGDQECLEIPLDASMPPATNSEETTSR